jgi:ADP-dependent phosphofructokinase/glucokinase
MPTTPPEKIVLGLGGTVDYEIKIDASIINRLIDEFVIKESEISNAVPILTERDLVLNLLSFMSLGSGGERFVSESRIIESFAHRFKIKVTLGGTCVRAAMAMDTFGISSTLHLVSISDEVRRLLPKSTKYICSSDVDTFDPHLIVQFAEGMKIEAQGISFITPSPNRIIFTNDPPNRDLVISNQLGDMLESADVFMISGFNCIQDPEVLDQRINDIQRHLKRLPKDSIVFFEDAGYHIPSLSKTVRERMINDFDVYSMNEEEMQSYLGRSLDLLDVPQMLDAFNQLLLLIPAKVMVIHTKFWAIALGQESSKYGAALQGGITMASTRYCFGDGFIEQNYLEVARMTHNPDGENFAHAMNSYFKERALCIPAFQLNVEKPTTIGLGDSFVGGFIAALNLTESLN